MWEYVRCVSEVRPRWVVWENVPGALSSGGGDDFRCLLEVLDALGYGLAWRVLDARFFGLAQRRERVWLVGHLGELPPVAVLFEPEGLRWDFEAGREKWQGLAAAAGIDLGVAGFKWHQGEGSRSLGLEGGQSPTLVADYHQPGCLTPWDVQSKRIYDGREVAPTLPSGTGEGANIQPCVFAQNTRDEVRVMPYAGAFAADAGAKRQTYVMLTSNTGANGSNFSADDVAYTLGLDNGNAVMCMADDTARASVDAEQAGALKAGGMPPSVAVDARNMRAEPELSGTLQAKPNGGQSLNYINPVAMKVRCGAETYVKRDGSTGTAGKGALLSEEQAFTVAATQDQSVFAMASPTGYVVRRLTPVECERLQGFPDGWTDIPYRGKEHPPDTPRYKALGNSWAVPCARWIGARIQGYENGEDLWT